MRTIYSFSIALALLVSVAPRAYAQAGLANLQELGGGAACNTVAVAPISTPDPLDGLRATVNYFEHLADSATTPLLVFLPTQTASTWYDGNRDDALRQLRETDEELRPRWIVFTDIIKCETGDHASKAYWREAGWLWSGPSQPFCLPRTRATLTATVAILDVESGEVVASSEIEATGERTGPMVRLHAAHEGLPCASGATLHAKAKGQALRDIGASLAYEVDRLLSMVMFQD